jgi:sulfopyruvate decarboxylase subunit beta
LTDLKEVALGAGVQNVAMVSDKSDLKEKLDTMENGVLVVKTEPGNKKVPVIQLCPADIIKRFMEKSAPPFHSV